MKNLLNIGGAVLLLVVLLSKKKEIVEAPYQGTGTPIIPDIPLQPELESRLQPITNASISPTLTSYQISETEALLNALRSSQNYQNPQNPAGDNGDFQVGIGGGSIDLGDGKG